jgi:hypothetical protein
MASGVKAKKGEQQGLGAWSKTCPSAPLSTTNIPRRLVWDRTSVSVMAGRQLTACNEGKSSILLQVESLATTPPPHPIVF